MMSQAMVTIVAKIAVNQISNGLSRVEAFGNPANPEIACKLDIIQDEQGFHFLSFHVLHPADLPRPTGNLVLEFSADGDMIASTKRLGKIIGPELAKVFELAQDWKGGDISEYLVAHIVKSGFGWTRLAGLPFSGTPGMTVQQIRSEAALANRVRELTLSQSDPSDSALERLELIRKEIRKDEGLAWALETPAAPAPQPLFSKPREAIGPLIWSFLSTYLWILAFPALTVLIYGALAMFEGFRDIVASHTSLPMTIWTLMQGSWTVVRWVFGALAAFVFPLLAIAIAFYFSLRSKEKTDWTSDLAPDRNIARKMLINENQGVQNHMVSVTVLKPGITRAITIRLAFWIIAGLARLTFKPGHLAEINTIHFARWVQIPGTRDILFFSNYGGSWESYLEDFITRAHDGLTAVWSNTRGFPRTENLFQKGATDGERFKRFARHSMVPTPFWYSAYPQLTTSNIRTNGLLRCGLAAAITEEDAQFFFAQIGSAERPISKLETTDIQSVIFGGLGFKPFGVMMLVDFAGNASTVSTRASGWLKDIKDDIAFGDGRRLSHPAVVTLALGPDALPMLGLPAEACETFPAAFLDGMTGPGRIRLLGDDPAHWTWNIQRNHNVALLVYGRDGKSTQRLVKKIKGLVKKYGHDLAQVVPLNKIPADRRDRKEPFGFVDGTSQPIIRGTYKSLRNGDPLHLVEAGEFILGYPDNRGNVPPGPHLHATHDPDNILPVVMRHDGGFSRNSVDAPRDIGRNGSFLVIRQLEQHTEMFWDFCKAEAERLAPRIKGSIDVNQNYIAAKMIGRWKDGSSLARNPYTAYSLASEAEQKQTHRVTTNPVNKTQIQSSASAVSKSSSTGGMIKKSESEERRRAAFAEDNDFLFGAEDPEGLRCPFGSHIRRANPRESFDPGSQEQIAISNRHRILRVGRSYTDISSKKSGLMFMCLNGDIERQFEFVQQTWMRSETFHGLANERDPLSVSEHDQPSAFTIPFRGGPVGLSPLKPFVTVRGGGYFFIPGKKLLNFLTKEN